MPRSCTTSLSRSPDCWWRSSAGPASALSAGRISGGDEFPEARILREPRRDLHRRALYTQWQRTFLHPSLLTFDAPTREECTVNRVNSNTPLQALVLLNDPIFVEAARVFAEKHRSRRRKFDGSDRVGVSNAR